MNSGIKYSLIAIGSFLILLALIVIGILSIIYTKGLSIDFLNSHINKQLEGNDVIDTFTINQAVIEYNEKKGIFLSAEKVEINLLGREIVLDSLLLDFSLSKIISNTEDKANLEIARVIMDNNLLESISLIFDMSSLISQKNTNYLFDTNYKVKAKVGSNSIKNFSIDLDVDYSKDDKKFIINKFTNENFYLLKPAILDLNNEEPALKFDFINFDLNFNSNNLYISDFHVGWHNFEYFAENGENNIFFEKSNAAEKKHQIGFNFTAPSGDFYLKTSGIFDFGKILPNEKYSEFFKGPFQSDLKFEGYTYLDSGNSPSTGIEIIINKFKNDHLALMSDSRIKFRCRNSKEVCENYTYEEALRALVANPEFDLTAILKKKAIIDYSDENFIQKEIDFINFSEFLSDSLYEDQEVRLEFDLDLTKNAIDEAIQNLKVSAVNDNFKINLNQSNGGIAKVELETSINRDVILDYIKGGLSKREANNNKLYNFLDGNLYQKQNLKVDFDLNFKGGNFTESASNIKISSYGGFDSNYILDDNKNPNYIVGSVSYELEINNLNTEKIYLNGTIDLGNIEIFIRQINLNKKNSEELAINFSGYFSNSEDSIFKMSSIDSDYDLSGEVQISNTNHIFFNNFKINNNRNVDLVASGDLSKRILNLDIKGSLIDLSQNKVEVNNKKKEYYLDTENYSIETDNVIFNGNVRVNDFKAEIIKNKSNLSVNSSATFESHVLSYSREKNDLTDTNLIISDDITHFVGDSHISKKLLSDGSMELYSIRNMEDLKAEVKIKLDDFVLINTPVSLKLLSLPSISGLVSIAEGEPGVRFGYGEINYTETKDLFSNIDAFAVSDSLGLVMDGSIDREKKIMDMKGEISPMHLVNAIIQKLPIIGNILVGNEGEGMFSIDFTLTGNQDEPEVDSVPLSIIKPRILERAIEFIEINN